ncbi:unnamed protein product [Rhodiola kirilowii]
MRPKVNVYARKEGVSTEPTFHVSVMFGKRDEPLLFYHSV